MHYKIWRLLITTGGVYAVLSMESEELIQTAFYSGDQELNRLMLKLISRLTLNLPTTSIVAQPFNVIKWQLKFNPVA